MIKIAERVVLGLELWETQEGHWRAARLQVTDRKQKLWMVTPRLEVHDTLTIDPGLIDINIAYGYMCAADVLTEFPFAREIDQFGGTPAAGFSPHPRAPAARDKPLFVETATDPVKAALADGIARCRRRCWELEHDLFGFQVPVGPFAPKSKGAVSNPDALLELRDLKTLLGIMVLARLHVVGHVPPGAGSWADKWERHRWKLADKPGAGATPRDAWAAHDRGIRTPRRGVTPAPIIAAATRQNIFVASPDARTPPGGSTRPGCWMGRVGAVSRAGYSQHTVAPRWSKRFQESCCTRFLRART